MKSSKQQIKEILRRIVIYIPYSEFIKSSILAQINLYIDYNLTELQAITILDQIKTVLDRPND